MRDIGVPSSPHQSTEPLSSDPHPPSAASARPDRLVAMLGGAAALVAYALYRNGRSDASAKAREEPQPQPGRKHSRASDAPVEVETTLTINRPRQELYQFWRRLENLPLFMRHLESVQETGGRRSHWVAKSPLGGAPVEWDAEIVEERDGQLLSWRSVEGSQVPNSGSVLFEEAPAGRGTQVRVHMGIVPPGGAAGRLAGKTLEPLTARQVHEDLRRFKSLVEAGEIPTTDGQPVGKRGLLNPRNPL